GWTNMADVNSITAPTSGAWFEYNQASSTTLWRYCYANNAAATCANTSAVSAATWTNLEIRIISSSAITFLINGSAVATLTGITYDGGATNKLGPEYVCAQGASSTTRFDCYIDYFQWRGVSSALR
ncbi:MAG TPA: hypothetical protein VLA88_01765, partial [Candidatus Saccharimonadales bacterium]|nr:hypothetical protein [Candidatus Saccharimonadales bacterium]